MKRLDLKKFHNILFIFDSQKQEQIVSILFERTILFAATYVKNFKEARELLSEETYDIVVFGDLIPGFSSGGCGYSILPDIRKYQASAIAIMVYADLDLMHYALSAGVDVVFSFEEVELENKFNEFFELVPIPKICR